MRDWFTEAQVEKGARSAWDVFRARQTRPDDWPLWGELLAQGHQGAHRVDEFRGYARAALSAIPDPRAAARAEGFEAAKANVQEMLITAAFGHGELSKAAFSTRRLLLANEHEHNAALLREQADAIAALKPEPKA